MWLAYIQKRGTLNDGMRLEVRTAQIMHLICSAAKLRKEDGSKFEVKDFVLHKNETDTEVTFENALRAFGKVVR